MNAQTFGHSSCCHLPLPRPLGKCPQEEMKMVWETQKIFGDKSLLAEWSHQWHSLRGLLHAMPYTCLRRVGHHHFFLWRIQSIAYELNHIISAFLQTHQNRIRLDIGAFDTFLTFHIVWWFGTCFIFPDIWNVIVPTDELIFFRGVCSTTNQIISHDFPPNHHEIIIYSG